VLAIQAMKEVAACSRIDHQDMLKFCGTARHRRSHQPLRGM